MIGQGTEVAVAFGRDRDDAAAPRPHLLHVRDDLGINLVGGRHKDDRHVRVDQRDGAVLHLRRGIALRVDITDLLELEGTLQRDREVHAASQIQRVGRIGELLRQDTHLRLQLQRAGHERGQLSQATRQLLAFLERQPVLVAQVEPEQPERRDLRRERLGRGDADFGAGVQIDAAVRLARNGAAYDVYKPDHARPRGARRAHRLERVGRLARLRNRDGQGPGLRELPAVAVLRGVLDGYRDLTQRLDDVPSHQTGVPGRAARYDRDATDRRAVGGAQVQAVEAGDSLFEHEAAAQRAAHRVGLLGDLFLHEVRVAVQLDRVEVPGHVVHRPELHVRLPVDDVVAVGREHCDVAVVE